MTISPRWLLLFFGSTVLFCVYYVYDIPSALQTQLKQSLSLNSLRFNLLYSVYSLPNCVMPLLGGALVDHYGTRNMLVFYAVIVAVGQGIFALGVSTRSYAFALLGRVVFGFGGESLNVAETTLVANWFHGRELALATSTGIAMQALGSVANDHVSPALSDHAGLDWALWLGFMLVVCGLVSGVFVAAIDRRHAVAVGRGKPKADSPEEGGAVVVPAPDVPHSSRSSLSVRCRRSLAAFATTVRTFEPGFWLLVAQMVVVYSAIFPFVGIVSEVLQDKYDYSSQAAGRLLSIPYSTAVFLTPFFGNLVDRTGHRTLSLFTAPCLLLVAHSLLGNTDMPPYIPLFVHGLGTSLYASAVWSSIPLSGMSGDVLGVAFGVATASLNTGLALTPVIVGSIQDNTDGYASTSYFFMALSALGIVLGSLLRGAQRTAAANGDSFCLDRPTTVADDVDQTPLLQEQSIQNL